MHPLSNELNQLKAELQRYPVSPRTMDEANRIRFLRNRIADISSVIDRDNLMAQQRYQQQTYQQPYGQQQYGYQQPQQVYVNNSPYGNTGIGNSPYGQQQSYQQQPQTQTFASAFGGVNNQPQYNQGYYQQSYYNQQPAYYQPSPSPYQSQPMNSVGFAHQMMPQNVQSIAGYPTTSRYSNSRYAKPANNQVNQQQQVNQPQQQVNTQPVNQPSVNQQVPTPKVDAYDLNKVIYHKEHNFPLILDPNYDEIIKRNDGYIPGKDNEGMYYVNSDERGEKFYYRLAKLQDDKNGNRVKEFVTENGEEVEVVRIQKEDSYETPEGIKVEHNMGRDIKSKVRLFRENIILPEEISKKMKPDTLKYIEKFTKLCNYLNFIQTLNSVIAEVPELEPILVHRYTKLFNNLAKYTYRIDLECDNIKEDWDDLCEAFKGLHDPEVQNRIVNLLSAMSEDLKNLTIQEGSSLPGLGKVTKDRIVFRTTNPILYVTTEEQIKLPTEESEVLTLRQDTHNSLFRILDEIFKNAKYETKSMDILLQKKDGKLDKFHIMEHSTVSGKEYRLLKENVGVTEGLTKYLENKGNVDIGNTYELFITKDKEKKKEEVKVTEKTENKN